MSGNLTSPKRVQEILKKFGLSAKKSLGQNFLIDTNILYKIVNAAELTCRDTVLEIGAGIGTLTKALSERAGSVVAVETDPGLFPVLKEVLSDRNNVNLVFKDILKTDVKTLITECTAPKVVANLPYYITTPIIFHLLQSDLTWERLVLLVQKEVAERVVSPPGRKTYGALSVMVRHYATAEIVSIVPPTVFMPRPKVDSAILRLKPKVVEYHKEEEEIFALLVRKVFQSRRKNLLNSVKSILSELGGEKRVIQAFQACGIDPGQRGETLSPDQFYKLASFLAKKGR